MALRAFAAECTALCSNLVRRSMHSSASTSRVAMQSLAVQGTQRTFSSLTTYTDAEIQDIEARIFGTHVGNGLPSGRKILRRKLIGQKIVDWYPEDIERKDPYMLSLEAERAKLKLDRLRRRGKAPPKKGSGKRSKR